MAHSKSGGTRSYIRGKVGSDVYSIGKNAKGKKQQVVRSLAETVANPQTIGQMKGRMIMSTIMQAVAAMRVIIDHSFDNVPSGQPCISEFIARNYALVKADVAANPSSGNQFGMVKYGEKGARIGAFLVSDGKAVLPACLDIAAQGAAGTIALTSDTLTGAGLKAALGLSSDEYITLLGFDKDGAFVYARLHIASDLADDTALTAANIASAFDIEGNVTPTFTLASNTFSIALNGANKGLGWIVSKKSDTGYKHNQCVIEGVSAPTYTANVAIQTYPVGGNAFLNGGEEEPSFNPAPSPSPEPAEQPQLLTLSAEGTDILSSSSSKTYMLATTLTGTCSNIPASGLALYAGNSKVMDITESPFTSEESAWQGQVTLKLNGTTIQTCGTLTKQVDDDNGTGGLDKD